MNATTNQKVEAAPGVFLPGPAVKPLLASLQYLIMI